MENIIGRLPLKTRRILAAILAPFFLGIFAGCNTNNNPVTETTLVQDAKENNNQEDYNPNSRKFIADKAVELIEEAAKAGKKLDAEDAVLAVIVANSDKITNGFMGELFGDSANQTYTYDNLVDAYLRVMMMQVENIGAEKTFNIKNVFASLEDYEYLSNIRKLVDSFKKAETKEEKNEIIKKLNEIAFNLCTYETYDISSAASVAAMLSLDGMRIITNNGSSSVVLPDDIRDEMFGNGYYACLFDATYEGEKNQVLPTIYSSRVSDLKRDIKTKLEVAVLEPGNPIIIAKIIDEVANKTIDIIIFDFDSVKEINEAREKNRDVTYAYESKRGKVKDNYSPITDKDKAHIETIDGKDVIVDLGDTIIPDNIKPEETKPSTEETKPGETNPTESTEPTGPIYEDKKEAENALKEEVIDAQAEANKGAEDGMNDAMSGKPKRDLSGKSEHYVGAYHGSYDAWKKIYDAQHSTAEDISVETEPEQTEPTTASETIATEPTESVITDPNSLDGLTLEQLESLQTELKGTTTSFEVNYTYTYTI